MQAAPTYRIPQPVTALDIKATTLTAPVIFLHIGHLGQIASDLAARIATSPEFFRNVPVIVDISRLQADDTVDFVALAELLRQQQLVPLAVRGAHGALRARVEAAHWAVLSDEAMRGEPAARAPAPRSAGATRVITQPVRSGQTIYAADSDLIVLAPVSPGAELIADGHIHVYGSLRGRALAGVRGNAASRIFCHDFRAELVAVAGTYRVNENFAAAQLGSAVQIYLDANDMIIEPLYHGSKL